MGTKREDYRILLRKGTRTNGVEFWQYQIEERHGLGKWGFASDSTYEFPARESAAKVAEEHIKRLIGPTYAQWELHDSPGGPLWSEVPAPPQRKGFFRLLFGGH